EVELVAAQPIIIQRSTEPPRYKMTKVDLAVVFELMNNVANDTAATVCGDRSGKINCAMRAIRTAKHSVDGAFEGLLTCLTKWRPDADDLCFTAITQILPGSHLFPANGAGCRIEQRYGCLKQLRFVERDHFLTTAASVSMLLPPNPGV